MQKLLVFGSNRGTAVWSTSLFQYLARRRQSHERLTYHGARLLDLRPAQLPVALVNRYFDIKQEGAL